MSNVKERTFLVTGVTRGIGRAITERLLEEGAKVLGLGRDFSALPEPICSHPSFTPIKLDLRDLSEVEKQAKLLLREHPEIYGFIGNAGIGCFGSIEELSVEQMRDTLHVNFLSHVILSKHTVPYMKRHKRGVVIFIGSEAALQGKRRGALYCASKFAIRGFTQALREECASSGIAVSLVNPGMVRTEFFAEQTFSPGPAPEHALQAREVANIVSYILSMPLSAVVEEVTVRPQQHKVVFQ